MSDAPAAPAPASRPERLITPPFAAVTAAALVFFVYIGIVVVTVPRLIEDELGAGEFGIGLTLASFALAAILARPFLGRLGDRYGRRRLMMGGAVLAAASGVLCGFAGSLSVLIVLRAGTGIGEAAMFVGAATLIADMSPPNRRAEAASYFSVAVFGGLGIGPVLGEAILGDDRFRLTFVVAGLVALGAAFLVLIVPDAIDRRIVGEEKPPFRFFHPAALFPGFVLACGVAAYSVYSSFLPDYSRTIGLSGAGALFLVYSVVCLLCRVFGARVPERLGAGVSVTFALAAIALASLLLAAVPEVWALWSAAVIMGVGMAFMYPALMALVVNSVDEVERASALSSFTMFFEAGSIIGGLALGGIGEVFGKRGAFLGG
ncbi:MAG TPA: MFS transporter, partial [Ilumatobacteraceae bacterium]